MSTDLTTTADLAPVLATAGSGIRVIRDTTTGAVAIVLDATAADALDLYLDGLGPLHDIAGDDADDARLAAADVVSTIRGLLRA
jgi:hypothetical protein